MIKIAREEKENYDKFSFIQRCFDFAFMMAGFIQRKSAEVMGEIPRFAVSWRN